MKLSPPQQSLMSYLKHGWLAQLAVCSVYVNGQRYSYQTIKVLERKGLVEKVGAYSWKATEAGKRI